MDKQKYYFTLLAGPQIAQAPSGHIIPAHEFSQAISGKELLIQVQEDATKYRQAVSSECEQIKEQAYLDGFASGFESWAEMIGLLEKEIARVRDEMQKSLMPIAVSAAKKIVGAEIAQRPEAIVDIIASTAKVVAQHKKIVIYVSRPDFQVAESSKNKLKVIFEDLESLSIRHRDDLTPGDIVIETEGGIINARLKDRWETISAALQSMQEAILAKIDLNEKRS